MIKIYPNEQQTANHAFAKHINNPEKILLLAKPGVQVGLTNTALVLAKHMFSEYSNLGFIFFSGLTETMPFLGIQQKIDNFSSINGVDDFDIDRVILARPELTEVTHYINNGLHSPLEKEDRRYTHFCQKEIKKIFIFLDEAHVGNGADSQTNKFIKHLNIKYGKTNVFVAAGSATPHTLLSGITENYLFHDSEVEVLDFFVGDDLFEAAECLKSGRLIDIDSLEKNLEHCMSFLNSKDFANQSFEVQNLTPEISVRCTSKQNQQKIKREMTEMLILKYGYHKNDLLFDVYNSDTKMKLEDSKERSPQRKQLHIHLPIKAFSISETISYERLRSFIGWLETKYSPQDEQQKNRTMISQVQCLRPFGYNKNKLKFPIIASRFVVEQMAKYWSKQNLKIIQSKDWKNSDLYIPNGTYSIGTNGKKTSSKNTFFREIASVEFFKTKDEIQNKYPNKSVTVISKNKSNDKRQILSDFLSGSSRGCEDRIIHVDGPQDRDVSGWELFIKKYPLCVDNPWIFINWTNKVKQNYSNIKSECIMRPNAQIY